eukprot:ctg_897.g377
MCEPSRSAGATSARASERGALVGDAVRRRREDAVAMPGRWRSDRAARSDCAATCRNACIASRELGKGRRRGEVDDVLRSLEGGLQQGKPADPLHEKRVGANVQRDRTAGANGFTADHRHGQANTDSGRVWLGSGEGVAEPAREYEVEEEWRCESQRARWEGGHWFVEGAFAFAEAVVCARMCTSAELCQWRRGRHGGNTPRRFPYSWAIPYLSLNMVPEFVT